MINGMKRRKAIIGGLTAIAGALMPWRREEANNGRLTQKVTDFENRRSFVEMDVITDARFTDEGLVFARRRIVVWEESLPEQPIVIQVIRFDDDHA